MTFWPSKCHTNISAIISRISAEFHRRVDVSENIKLMPARANAIAADAGDMLEVVDTV